MLVGEGDVKIGSDRLNRLRKPVLWAHGAYFDYFIQNSKKNSCIVQKCERVSIVP